MNLQTFIIFIKERFSLRTGKEAWTHTIQEATEWSSIRWSNLWILLLAIIICSIWLNTNSPAVVIWAMLISPLMGPIIWIGVWLAIYDTSLIKKWIRNLSVAFILSLVVSSIYFSITPLTEPTKEIIARISPTIWDVIIAFAWWLVGAIALTRKEKSLTFIPWVAIATALMPPLCVTWYRLVQWNFIFALKSFYLLFINSVFIAGSTFIIAKLLHLPKTVYPTIQRKKIVQFIVRSIVIITAIPSTIMTVNILKETIINQSVNSIKTNISNLYNVQILETKINYDDKEIWLWLLWTYLSQNKLDNINILFHNNNLLKDYKISIKQWVENDPNRTEKIITPILSNALETQEEKTMEFIKQSLDNFKDSIPPSTKQLLKELQIINKNIISINKTSQIWDNNVIIDYYLINTDTLIPLKDKEKITSRLRIRLNQEDLQIERKI